jgi:type I restriction enzyme S subunit
MNRMQAWSGMFGTGSVSGIVSPDYAVYKILGDHDCNYLLTRLKAIDLVSQFAIESKGIGTGFNRLYNDRLGAISISLPPPDEQKAITNWIEANTRKLSSAISRSEREIELMREYRMRLTADIVTGKLDVRTAAAKLPAEPEEVIISENSTDEAGIADETEIEET